MPTATHAMNLLLILSALKAVTPPSVALFAQQATLTGDASYPKAGNVGGGPGASRWAGFAERAGA